MITCKVGIHFFKKDNNYVEHYEYPDNGVEYSEKCLFCDTYRTTCVGELFGKHSHKATLENINDMKKRQGEML